jgi:argininosuccinate synthase
MSYDLMVFEASKAPKERKEFMEWYKQQTQWSEDHNYLDHAVSSVPLQLWFEEMAKDFPPMSGALATDDVDDPKITDFSIGKDVIYSAFSWSVAEEAYPKMRALAIKHSVGFFDVSANNGEILFPPEVPREIIKKPWWKIW